MNNQQKWIGGIIGVVVILGLIWWSVGADFGGGTSEEPLQKVKIADLPVIHGLPLYLALEKGYFKEAGIDAELVKIDAPNLIIDSLLAGSVDFASPSGALGITGIAAFNKPGSLQIWGVAGGDDTVSSSSISVPLDSTATSIQDLKGKKIGVLPGIQWRTIARHILAENNLVDSDVQLVELAPGLQATALASKQVDALLAVEPIPTIVKQKNIGRDIVSGAAEKWVANPFYGGAGVVRTEFAEQNPELTEKVLGVFDKAIKEIRKNPEAAKQYYKGYTPLEDAIIPQAPVLRFKMYNELTADEVSAIQKFYDIFTTYEVIKGKINVRELIYSPSS